eukprot:1046161-Heterocapsa_arctica.AAC.1
MSQPHQRQGMYACALCVCPMRVPYACALCVCPMRLSRVPYASRYLRAGAALAQHESEGTHVFALPCWRVRPGLPSLEPLSNFLDRRALVRGYAEVALVQTA